MQPAGRRLNKFCLRSQRKTLRNRGISETPLDREKERTGIRHEKYSDHLQKAVERHRKEYGVVDPVRDVSDYGSHYGKQHPRGKYAGSFFRRHVHGDAYRDGPAHGIGIHYFGGKGEEYAAYAALCQCEADRISVRRGRICVQRLHGGRGGLRLSGRVYREKAAFFLPDHGSRHPCIHAAWSGSRRVEQKPDRGHCGGDAGDDGLRFSADVGHVQRDDRESGGFRLFAAHSAFDEQLKRRNAGRGEECDRYRGEYCDSGVAFRDRLPPQRVNITSVFIIRQAGEGFRLPFFHQTVEPDKEPEDNRQSDGGDQAGGKETAGIGSAQTCHKEGDQVQGNKQNDTDQCGDLLWGLFFHGGNSFSIMFWQKELPSLFPRSNEPSSHACMDIWRLPRGL